MVSVKRYFLVSLILILSSCAKPIYLIEQGLGQMSLISRGEWNAEVLKSNNVSEDDKEKIKKIIIYKKYFYKFWSRKEEQIYSKTTFLEGEAVTWLVIASPHNEIKARKECFPLMGCFPYLGFFSKDSAKSYLNKLSIDGLSTYMRPVYAYSTLGYFTDNILSSFFFYKEFELAELIFHELFHTIFFAKDEVDFNENLANYFGREMANEYFKKSDQSIKLAKAKRKKYALLNQEVSNLALELNKEYKSHSNLSKESSKKVLDRFIAEVFRPSLKSKCEQLKLPVKQCSPLKKKWNNASLASYLTYQKNVTQIEQLRIEKKMSLKEYFSYIYQQYKKYQSEDPEGDFAKYLFK
jgi:predicted aminopeptidase